MRLRDLFLVERPEPTGREPVNDPNPATREEMAELGRRFATQQPRMQAAPRSRLFNTADNYETGAHGPGVRFR
jgi:hypothetical protein